MKKIDVTVAVPTFNAERELHWRGLIEGVLEQNTSRTFELLVVDSGSTDNTVSILQAYDDPRIRLVQIPNSEFGHGKTRNYIARIARGDIVIFITQDAVPAHKKWLDEMAHPFSVNEKIAAVYGKQIPRNECVPIVKRDMVNIFDSFGVDGALTLQYKDPYVGNDFPAANTFLSDANSAVRRKIIVDHVPFRDVSYAEDQYLGIDLIEAGYIKVYAPFASVVHSHSYKLKKYFKRMVDEYNALKSVHPDKKMVSTKELIFGTIAGAYNDIIFIIKDGCYDFPHKIWHIFWALPYNLARRMAGRLVDHEGVRKQVHGRLSLEKALKKQS